MWNIIAYDAAILPEAKPSDFATVIWGLVLI